jgi:ribosomal protein L28
VVMRERKCELLGKRANRDARLVSFSHIRSKKHQHVNLHEKRVWWAEVRVLHAYMRMCVCVCVCVGRFLWALGEVWAAVCLCVWDGCLLWRRSGLRFLRAGGVFG